MRTYVSTTPEHRLPHFPATVSVSRVDLRIAIDEARRALLLQATAEHVDQNLCALDMLARLEVQMLNDAHKQYTEAEAAYKPPEDETK